MPGYSRHKNVFLKNNNTQSWSSNCSETRELKHNFPNVPLAVWIKVSQ